MSLEAAPTPEAATRAEDWATALGASLVGGTVGAESCTAPGACLSVVGGTVSALVCTAPGASFAVVGGTVSARCGVACETAGDEYTRARASEMD